MNKQNAFRRGFTLIELMIVIVILGILMGTILPRLTGAQSRARDTARIADLNNISQALEVYASDFGKYPDANCTDSTAEGELPCDGETGAAHANSGNCLHLDATDDSTDGTATDTVDTYHLLKGYLKGARVPQNVGKKTNSRGCVGSYYYEPLSKGGSDNASYLLLSDLETWQMANFDLSQADVIAAFTSGKAADFVSEMNKLTPPGPTTETDSVYVVVP